MKKFVLKSFLVGLLIPIFFLAIFFVEFFFPGPWVKYSVLIFTIPGLLLWPTGIWLMAVDFNHITTEGIYVLIASIAAISIIYGIIGMLGHLITNRKKQNSDSSLRSE
ncbi:MAG: hypothetical protein ACYDFU_09250 [Nitrospirota bacterium]